MLTTEREQRIKLLGTGYEKELLAELDRVRAEAKERNKWIRVQAELMMSIEKERDQLKGERDEIPTRWDKFYAHEMSEAKKLHDEIKQLREKLEVAVNTLEFYSIRKNYACPCGKPETCECGGRAREALAKICAEKPVDEWTQTLREDAQNS